MFSWVQEDWRRYSRPGPDSNATAIVRCCYNWMDCYRYTSFSNTNTISRKYFLSMVGVLAHLCSPNAI